MQDEVEWRDLLYASDECDETIGPACEMPDQ